MEAEWGARKAVLAMLYVHLRCDLKFKVRRVKMLRSDIKNEVTRSFRSFKAMMTFYGDDSSMHSSNATSETLDLSINEVPSVIHLPPSIPSLDNLSPRLWNWILSSQFNSKLVDSDSVPVSEIVVKSYEGQDMKPFPPPHLVGKEESCGASGKTSNESTISATSGGRKSSRFILEPDLM